MCNMKQYAPDAAGMGGAVLAGDPSGTSPTMLPSNAPGATGDMGPRTVDTKFGKLMKVLVPVLTGSGIGATANYRVPGAGSEAAQNFFDRKRQFQMQKLILQRQAQNDFYRNALEAARTQHEISMPAAAAGSTRTWTAVDPADATSEPDKPHIFSLDPFSMKVVDRGLAVAKPTAGSQPKTTIEKTDQGFVPVTTQDGKATTGEPLTTTAQRDVLAGDEEGAPQIKGAPVPLMPFESTTKKDARAPQPELVNTTDDTGASTSRFVDKNPESPTFGKTISGPIGSKSAKAPSISPARSQSIGDKALQLAGNNSAKALQMLDQMKTLSPSQKAIVEKYIQSKSKKNSKLDSFFSAAPQSP